MIRNIVLLVTMITIGATVTAFGQVGCRSWKFVGSYVRVDPPADVFGDGSVVHQFIFNMTLNADGTAYQFWTGSLDYPMNSGTSSPGIGSWTCRMDGKLVVTFLSSVFSPTAPGAGHPVSDVSLASHQRISYLFSVDDESTLTRIQARERDYAAGADPTNPAGGTLGPLSSRTITYKRLIATDADLLLP